MDKLEAELSEMKRNYEAPQWFNAAGWALFKSKYLSGVNNPAEQYARIATVLAKHAPGDKEYWRNEFFRMLWKGEYSASTPTLANTGTNRGLVASCAGNYISDSIDGMFSARRENAILSKTGHGTSSFIAVRHRGAPISAGGFALGAGVEFERQRQTSIEVSQGGIRRGAWAGYLPIDHKDFDEVWQYVHDTIDDCNVGWNISDEFAESLHLQEPEAMRRYRRVLYLRAKFGRGYMFFPDKANRLRPKYYDLDVKASNLCNEIVLGANEEYTFSCIIGALNLVKWSDIALNDSVFKATILLDCITSEYIACAKGIPGLEKIVHYTEDYRSIGLGVMGLHSMYQVKGWAFDSMEAHLANGAIFKNIQKETERASRYLATELGEPNKLKGTGLRNSHRTAMMPTMSTALIMGGYSEGISPMVTNIFTQDSAGGGYARINPVLETWLKDRALYTERNIAFIEKEKGSVKNFIHMTEHEKEVFATAFEIPQDAIIRQAASRQRYICQGQSLNLFFSQHETEAYVSAIHKLAVVDPYILGLYYVRSSPDAASMEGAICAACQ